MKFLLSPRCLMALLAIAFVSGCTNPGITQIKPGAVLDKGTIYVARFDGNPVYVADSTAGFLAELKKHSGRTIIEGPLPRVRGQAASLAAAKRAGAKILITGEVHAATSGPKVSGYTTLRVYNVATGELEATIRRSSGILRAKTEHECVMLATQHAAEALLRNL